MYLAKSGRRLSSYLLGTCVLLVACGGRVELEGGDGGGTATNGNLTDAGAKTDARPSNPPGTNCTAKRTATCDFCGNITCPAGTSNFSDCKCHVLQPDGTAGDIVAPTEQACNDQCCNIVCPAGEYLDFACACYAP